MPSNARSFRSDLELFYSPGSNSTCNRSGRHRPARVAFYNLRNTRNAHTPCRHHKPCDMLRSGSTSGSASLRYRQSSPHGVPGRCCNASSAGSFHRVQDTSNTSPHPYTHDTFCLRDIARYPRDVSFCNFCRASNVLLRRCTIKVAAWHTVRNTTPLSAHRLRSRHATVCGIRSTTDGYNRPVPQSHMLFDTLLPCSTTDCRSRLRQTTHVDRYISDSTSRIRSAVPSWSYGAFYHRDSTNDGRNSRFCHKFFGNRNSTSDRSDTLRRSSNALFCMLRKTIPTYTVRTSRAVWSSRNKTKLSLCYCRVVARNTIGRRCVAFGTSDNTRHLE